MDVRLLGPVEIHGESGVVRLARSGERCVLAALALDPGRPVSAVALADHIWSGDAQSDKVLTTVGDYVRKVRAAIKRAGGQPAWLRTDRSAGTYALDVEPPVVDHARFIELARTGRARDDIRLLQESLSLWRGPALANVSGLWAESRRFVAESERLDVYQDILTLQLDAGRGIEVARTVTALFDDVVPTEALILLGARGLVGSGRFEALPSWIERAKRRMWEATGAGLSPELLDRLDRLRTPPGRSTRPTSRPAPHQLPFPPTIFVGREAELAILDRALSPADDMFVAAITGLAGIGKSWLALRWADRHRDRFPDGQLHVNLRGFTPGTEPMAPELAIAVFLDALGVPPNEVPDALEARAGLYRTLVNDRRMLVVLDNAHDTAQVVPLLPGTAHCAVVVTSRDRLPGLTVAHGARHVPLEPLDPKHAHDLLVERVGHDRLAEDADAVAGLVAGCAGLPLALGIVAGRIDREPGRPLAALAAELREADSQLAALDGGDSVSSVPAALSWSCAALPADQRTVFQLLGTAPGLTFGPDAAASLTGLPPGRVRPALDGLVRVSLLESPAADRWRMHDLVAAFAASQAEPDQPASVRSAAVDRLTDHYLHTAAAGRRLLHPQLSDLALEPPAPGIRIAPLTDAKSALTWFEHEHETLLAVQRLARDRGRPTVVWHLAWALIPFHWRRGHVQRDVEVWTCATTVVDDLPEPAARMAVHRNAGQALSRAGRHEEALEHLHDSLGLAQQTGDLASQAQAHLRIAQARALTEPGDAELDHARRAAELHRRTGNAAQEATALNSAGWACIRLDRHPEARENCEAALDIFRDLGLRDGQAAALDSLGLVAFRTGDHDQALRCYLGAAALCREVNDDYNLADVLDRLGTTHHARGDTRRAHAAWREAAQLYQVQERHTDAERTNRCLTDYQQQHSNEFDRTT